MREGNNPWARPQPYREPARVHLEGYIDRSDYEAHTWRDTDGAVAVMRADALDYSVEEKWAASDIAKARLQERRSKPNILATMYLAGCLT